MSKTSIEVLTKTSDVVKTKKKSKDNYFEKRSIY